MSPNSTSSKSNSRNPTREVQIGSIKIGANHPIAVQSMTATRTRDIEATIEQIVTLEKAGADVVRVAQPCKQRQPLRLLLFE